MVDKFDKPYIWAIIVLYKPDLEELIKNLNAILHQVHKVILLDNSNDPEISILKDYSSKIIYQKLPYNKGLGAINIGLKIAEKTKLIM